MFGALLLLALRNVVDFPQARWTLGPSVIRRAAQRAGNTVMPSLCVLQRARGGFRTESNRNSIWRGLLDATRESLTPPVIEHQRSSVSGPRFRSVTSAATGAPMHFSAAGTVSTSARGPRSRSRIFRNVKRRFVHCALLYLSLLVIARADRADARRARTGSVAMRYDVGVSAPGVASGRAGRHAVSYFAASAA